MASNISYNSYWGYYGINWSNASGNNNIIYSGQGDGNLYRSRIVLDTTGMIISSSSKLVVKITVAQQGSQYYDSTVARLSTYNLTNPGDYFKDDGYTPIAAITNSTISQSRFYTDSNGNSPVGSAIQANGNTLYLVFDTKNRIIAGEKYYIYIGREGTSSSRFNAFQASEINLTYESYTKCGAPTSVSLNKEYVAPNENFTVSWGAGTGGNANDISGYRIYYKFSSSASFPSTSDEYFVVGKDTRSLTISASRIMNEIIRGYHITFAVQTVGYLGPTYDSDLKTHSGRITINTLPKTDSMMVSTSKEILPSTGGMVTFNLSGATDDHHSVSYAYATSETGTKNLISGNSVSLNISKNTTVYFWAYDGLEYSAGNKSQTIQINTKPTCSILLESENVEDTDSVVPSGYKYILSPAFVANKDNDTLSNNNSFSYYYRIYNNPEADPILENSYSSGERLSITDVRSVFSISPPYYYSFGVKVNDGIEDSDVIWTNKYYVTGAPAIKNIYNTNTGNNVEEMGQYDGQDSFYFSKQLSFDFVYDTGYNGKSFFLSKSSKSAQVNKLANERTLRAFFSDCGIATPGEHILSGYFLNKVDCSCQASRTMYRIHPFEIKNLSVTNCKPHTNSNIYASIASNNLGGAITNPKQFGIDAKDVDSIESFVGTLNYQDKTLTRALKIGSKGDTFKFENFTYDHDSFRVNQDETYTMAFTLSLTNAFGETYSGSQNITVDYKEDPIINKIDIKLPNDTNEIKQGQKIIITISYENCYNSGQTLSFNTPYGTQEVDLTEVKEVKTFEFEVPETQSTREINKLDFVITNDANTSDSLEVKTNIKFLKHTTPNVVLTRTDYNDQDKELTVYFSPSDWGLDPILLTAPGVDNKPNNNIDISLNAKNGKKTLSFKYDKNLKSCTFNQVKLSENDTWESVPISLEITVTSYTYEKTTHTQENTNTILVYNSTPTVAYRKNQLGINTKDPTGREEALVVIGGASGRNQIFYETNQDKPYCKVINFQFNGGSWTSGLDDDDIGVIIGDLPSAENLFF